MDIIISDEGVQLGYYLHERIVQIYMDNRVVCNVYYLYMSELVKYIWRTESNP